MTKEQVLNKILKLSDESKTAREIGAIVGLTKNAVMGRLYRHKTKNGICQLLIQGMLLFVNTGNIKVIW